MSDRYQALGRDLDDLKARVFARLGTEDVQYVRRMNRASRALEVVGRGLIHFSFEPITFTAGVLALWLHKQLQATEIGHTALHGAYDKLPGGEDFAQDKFYWHVPIDEESWRRGHNHEHHGNTNVAGRDPDIEFGVVRLTEQTPHRPVHNWQLPLTLLFLFPNFGALMNLHFTGLDKPKAQRPKGAWRRAFRKYSPYYAREYVLFPALAGPFWWKVLLANWLTEMMRDVYSAATIYCGHVGDDVASWPEGTKPRSRGEWYAMQIQATNDFEVPLPVSVLCGGLDRQIEHHLFPTLPPPRLREIAPEVRAICERHGIAYKTGSWPQQLRKALRHVKQLARDGGARAVMREAA